MRKTLAIVLFGTMAATAAFADYIVVLKDGRRLEAKDKWKVVNGKAIIELKTGTRVSIDPASIDAAASESATRSGLGDVTVLKTTPTKGPAPAPDQPSLGSLVTLRKPEATKEPESTRPARTDNPPATASGNVDLEVASKFKAAFENIGLFDAKISPVAAKRIRIDVNADTEDQVFNAISATAFIFANVPSDYDVVELYMKTYSGGSSGRFQMSLEDAKALAEKKIDRADYFIRNVIF